MVTENQMIVRLFFSVILGGLIGLEREIHEKAAGLRTHIMVCMGSCLIMLLSMHMFDLYNGIANIEPTRIAAQVVSGIGFLGAGTIIRARASVYGLTTAASLWTVSGLGLAIGGGLYRISMVATVLILTTLLVLNKVLDKTVYRHKI